VTSAGRLADYIIGTAQAQRPHTRYTGCVKAPAKLEALSVGEAELGRGSTYPPLGFVPVWDAELGNGDYYGLYWPYGKENDEPIVCDMLHDEWGMAFAFSSVPVFLDWLEANDHQRGEVEVEDQASVVRRFQAAKALIGRQPEAAVPLLREVCATFPESAEYWYTLASQLRRIGEHQAGHAAAVRAFASNWAFGLPPNGTVKLLQNARGQLDDPLVQRSGELNLAYGGSKENANYRILRECIAAYLSSATPVLGLLLNQNLGYMMVGETTAFQERHGFEAGAWAEEHRQLCHQYLGDARTTMT
jgi:hypothetical protein